MTLKFSGFLIFFEDENLYSEPKEIYPMTSTTSDSINCFFSLINQYKKNRQLIKIKNETPKLITDKKENVLGGKNGSVNESRSNIATITLMK
ncbi:hypothetical protein GCM10023311_08360 [Flaviramulus aquimarinus]|uniref:Uncharacterized protein n=1 Tax=Flaviramulus aquimarinus TaxID=1170456 RepID=A0ABP9F0K8_9FLAO